MANRNSRFGDTRGNMRIDSVYNKNEAMNLDIPSAFSYAYGLLLPPQPEVEGRFKKKSSRFNGHLVQTKSHSSGMAKSRSTPTRLSPQPEFTATKSGRLHNARNNNDPSSSRVQNQNFQTGELYDEVAENLARTFQAKILADREWPTSKFSSSSSNGVTNFWESSKLNRITSGKKRTDGEPRLEDYQSNSYSRKCPTPIETPPKPLATSSTGGNHDFDTIQSDKLMGEESRRFT